MCKNFKNNDLWKDRNFETHKNGRESKRIAGTTIVKIELNSHRSPLIYAYRFLIQSIRGNESASRSCAYAASGKKNKNTEEN